MSQSRPQPMSPSTSQPMSKSMSKSDAISKSYYSGISKSEFLTLKNIQECESLLYKHVLATKNIDLSNDTRARKAIYTIMKDIAACDAKIGVTSEEIKTMSIKELNNLTLNIAREVVLQLGQGTQLVGTQVGTRELVGTQVVGTQGTQVVGTREHLSKQNIASRTMDTLGKPSAPRNLMNLPDRPVVNSLKDIESVNSSFDRMVKSRDSISTMPPPLPSLSLDEPIGADDLNKMFMTMSSQRSIGDSQLETRQTQSYDVEIPVPMQFGKVLERVQESPVPTIGDSLAIMRMSLDDQDRFKTLSSVSQYGIENTIIPPPSLASSSKKTRYVMLAGFDRNWETERSRYSFTVNVAGYDAGSLQSFKNVVAMSATSVIIPLEASYMATSATMAGALSTNSSICFGYPYLLLNIENQEVYDGTNDAIRGCFSVMKYDNAYRAPNGRGYVIMIPVQDEVKHFINPLSSLQNLKISLAKPNGALVSNAQDDYRIVELQYETFNRLYIKVVTNKYFDKNEFFHGDSIYFKNCLVSSSSGTLLGSYDTLVEFLNRPSGHDVVELGQPNDTGVFKTFYILAPGELDHETGKIVLNSQIVSLVQNMDPDAKIDGGIINASLQLTISMKIDVAQAQENLNGIFIQ